MSRPDDIDSRLARLERRSKLGWLVAGLVLLAGWAPLLGAALVMKDGLRIKSAAGFRWPLIMEDPAVGDTHAQLGTTYPLFLRSNWPTLGFNLYFDGATTKYGSTNPGGALVLNNSGNFVFQTAPSGTKDNSATTTDRLIIDQTTALGNGTHGLVNITANSSLGVGGCTPFSLGDMCVARAGGATGVVYFGNTGTPYLYYDGTNFNFNGGKVVSGGNNTATCSQGGATCTPNLGTCCTVTVPSGTSSCWCGNQSAFNPGTCLVSGTTASCYSSAAGGNTIRVGWF